MEYEELKRILEQLDILIKKLGQNKVSKKDIEALREIIFHLDALIIKVKTAEKSFPLLPQLLEDLTVANDHLRKVLLDEEATTYVHQTTGHQQTNDKFFANLVSQIKKF